MKYYDVNFETVWTLERLRNIVTPFIVFAGRSNVGKSTFVNRLFNRKRIARVGKTPGTTRNVNVFDINNILKVVDLPGYGYAKLALKRTGFNETVLDRLFLNEFLFKILFLMDIRHIGNDRDLDFFHILLENKLMDKTMICLSKSDKLSNNKTISQRNKFAELLSGLANRKINIFLTSKLTIKDAVPFLDKDNEN